MNEAPSHETKSGTDVFWKRLFTPGSFEWQFKMRGGEAERFFAPSSENDELLQRRKRKVEQNEERYLAVTPEGKDLVEATWQLALEWGHVCEPGDGCRSLAKLTEQWEPDLLILDQENLSFAAGAVCFPSSWSIEERIGQSIHDVHEVVPRLNPQIGDMITRFLSKMLPGKSSRRENWSITRTSELDYHPALQRQALDESVTMDELFLRVESQLFTGISGGVLMGLRIETAPLSDLATDPVAWNAIAEKLRTMPEDVADYKSLSRAIPAILSHMEDHAPL